MLKTLEKYSKIIKKTRIHRYEQFGMNLRLRVELELSDQSKLYIRETIIEGEKRKYSYHWQDKKSNLKIRWDNAPDWDVNTKPHHIHIGNEVESSYERTLDQVLNRISKLIN